MVINDEMVEEEVALRNVQPLLSRNPCALQSKAQMLYMESTVSFILRLIFEKLHPSMAQSNKEMLRSGRSFWLTTHSSLLTT